MTRYCDSGKYSIVQGPPLSTQFFGWTVLRGSLVDESGRELGRAVLQFKYSRHFLPMLISMRPIRRPQPATHA